MHFYACCNCLLLMYPTGCMSPDNCYFSEKSSSMEPKFVLASME